MRAVVAVLLFVTAAHAALWGLFQEKQPAPDFRGILPSVSYAAFEPGHTVADSVAEPPASTRTQGVLSGGPGPGAGCPAGPPAR